MTEDEFGRTLADLFFRLGFEVDHVPAAAGGMGGLIVRYPSRIRHAIAVVGATGVCPVDASLVQEVLELMRRYGAGEGWAVTDATFAPTARELAMASGVRLIEGSGLSGLLTQAATDRGREAAVDALLAHSGFYDEGGSVVDNGAYAAPEPTAMPREPQIQPTVMMPRPQTAYVGEPPSGDTGPAVYDGYGASPRENGHVIREPRQTSSRRRSSGCRAGCVTVLVIMLVLVLFLMGMLLALPTVLDQLPLGEGLAAIKAHALTFFGQLGDAVVGKLGSLGE